MDLDKQQAEDIESVRGMKLGDPISYLSNALDDLDESQIDPNQLNFPVPQDTKTYLAEKRAEAAEVLKQMDEDAVKASDVHQSEITKEKQESIIDKPNPSPTRTEEKTTQPQSKSSPSWSDFNSPNHEPLVRAKDLDKLESIKEESPKQSSKVESQVENQGQKTPTIKKRMAARIYIKKEDAATEGNRKIDSAGDIVLDEHGSNLNKSDSFDGKKKEEDERNKKNAHLKGVKEHKAGKPKNQSRYVEKNKNEVGGHLNKGYEKEESYYEDQYDDSAEYYGYDEDYDNYETSAYLRDSTELVNAINQEFSNANLYPSDDHTDHIFYLHNSEGMTERDVYFYTMGVSKERAISFSKKTMDMMTKLEGLLALANKNLNHTTTNLKISENNITSLHAYKKEVTHNAKKDDTTPKWTIKTQAIVEDVKKREDRLDKGKDVMTEQAPKPKSQSFLGNLKPGALTIRDREDAIKTVEADKSSDNPYEKSSHEQKMSDKNPMRDDNMILTEKIVALHMINMSDKFIENDAILQRLLPMVTDKLIEKIRNGDAQYREAVLKIMLSNLKKQVQSTK